MLHPAVPRSCHRTWSFLSLRTRSKPRNAVPCVRTYATRPLAEDDLHTLKIDGQRMMQSLHDSCHWGKGKAWGVGLNETGMARLTLTEDDMRARTWLMKEVRRFGCNVTVDKIGNMFAVRPGQNNDLPPIMMGSHLDTQPTGGRYDGILGIHAALEALRTLHDAGVVTNSPIGLVNWTNEEGALFPKTTMGSSVWAGLMPLQEAWELTEVSSLAQYSPRSVKTALEDIGFLGDVEASHTAQPIAAHFELHIEQGPVLEDRGRKIAAVTQGQAYSWWEVTVKGRDAHAGTTPLEARSDAMRAAANMIRAADHAAWAFSGLATVGSIEAQPGSINTIAHTVKFTLDIRHRKHDSLSKLFEGCRKAFERVATEQSGRGVEFSMKPLTKNDTVIFDRGCVMAIEDSATAVLAEAKGLVNQERRPMRLISGAGHDSCAVSHVAPAAMIFTPTRNGMSHTPDEYCKPEDCILGAQTLMGAALRYDLDMPGYRSKSEEGTRMQERKAEEDRRRVAEDTKMQGAN